MAVTHSVAVYGFGSAFADTTTPIKDVDLLIVHAERDSVSLEHAIECNRRLVRRIAGAHVTMLSASEEAHFQFIKTAKAIRLGQVRKGHSTEDFEALVSAIRELNNLNLLPRSARLLSRDGIKDFAKDETGSADVSVFANRDGEQRGI